MAARIESVAGDLPGAVMSFRCGCCSRVDGWITAGEGESRGWATLVFTHLGRILACPECMASYRRKASATAKAEPTS